MKVIEIRKSGNLTILQKFLLEKLIDDIVRNSNEWKLVHIADSIVRYSKTNAEETQEIYLYTDDISIEYYTYIGNDGLDTLDVSFSSSEEILEVMGNNFHNLFLNLLQSIQIRNNHE